MQKTKLISIVLIVAFVWACSRSDESNNYRSQIGHSSKSIVGNDSSTPYLASNTSDPSDKDLQNQPDNNGFIVGNGQSEDVQGGSDAGSHHGEPILYLSLAERAESIDEIYIVGQEASPVRFNLVGNDSVAISGIEGGGRVSFIIKTSDKWGIKTQPLELVKDNPQTAQINLQPLQTVTGKAVNLGESGEISIAGTKMVASKPDSNGIYLIQDVPVGSHTVSIKGQSEVLLVSSEVEDNEAGHSMPDIDAQLQFASLCEGQDLEERTINFDSFESYQAISDDKAIGFKNNIPILSQSKQVVSYGDEMLICGIEMLLYPNELALSLNNNLLYTQAEESKDDNVMSVKNPLEKIIDGIVEFFTKLFEFLVQTNQPLVIGFDGDSQPSLVNNVFRASQFSFDLFCTKDLGHCNENIDHVEIKLRVGAMPSALDAGE